MKAGVVGLGQMGLQHAAILSVLTGNKVCVYDTNSFLLRLAGKITTNLCVHKSLEELAGRESPDVLYICTPVQTHLKVIERMAGLEREVGLFIEKPLSFNYESAEKIISLTNHLRGSKMVGFQKRFNGVYVKLKHLVDEGVLGDVRFYRAHSFSYDVPQKLNGWKFEPRFGGVTMDFGAHLVDLLIWLFGYPKVDCSFGCSLFSESVEDYTQVTLIHNQIKGTLELGWSMRNYAPNEHSIEIHGTEGFALATDDELIIQLDEPASPEYPKGRHTFHTSQLTQNPKYLLTYPEYALEDQYFLNSFDLNRKAEPDFNHAALVNKLIDEIKVKAKEL